MSSLTSVFIDSNIILRLLTDDVVSQQKKARLIFEAIEQGKFLGKLSILAVNEIIWIMENYYEKSRQEYLPQVIKLLSLRNIKIVEIRKQDLVSILKLLLESSIDFTDMYLKYFAKESRAKIASFDRDFDKMKEVDRIDKV